MGTRQRWFSPRASCRGARHDWGPGPLGEVAWPELGFPPPYDEPDGRGESSQVWEGPEMMMEEAPAWSCGLTSATSN